jgi:hypothetical protein
MSAKKMEGLKMTELRAVARKHGINSFGKTKTSLIREIQIAEGNFDCFGSAVEYCDQWGCRYRPLCFDEAQKWSTGKQKKPPTSRKKRRSS